MGLFNRDYLARPCLPEVCKVMICELSCSIILYQHCQWFCWPTYRLYALTIHVMYQYMWFQQDNTVLIQKLPLVWLSFKQYQFWYCFWNEQMHNENLHRFHARLRVVRCCDFMCPPSPFSPSSPHTFTSWHSWHNPFPPPIFPPDHRRYWASFGGVDSRWRSCYSSMCARWAGGHD